MSLFVFSQILAACTLAIGMAAFQFRERRHILRGWFLAALFAAAHFLLLGNIEAAMLVTITALRFLVSSFTTRSWLMYLFLGLTLAGFAVTYDSPVSLLALAATIIGTIGSFRQNETAIRFAMMTTEVLWAIHNIIVWSPVAIAMELLFFASNLLGYLRHRSTSESAL